MTRAQFAIAVGAPEKWVHNAAAALGRRIRYTRDEARRLAVVHAIQSAIGGPVRRGDRLAARALLADPGQAVVIGTDLDEPGHDEHVRLSIDLPHILSAYAARLARAAHHQPRRRGRRVARRQPDARARARAYGLDLTLIDHHLALTTEQRLRALDENAPVLTALRHRAAR
jgi:hypothetical protein